MRGLIVPFIFLNMDIKNFLETCVNNALENHPELFLVNREYNEANGKYTFIIDGDQGFNIQQCGKISRLVLRQIEENPEAEAQREDFSFEIASPGAEKPLFLKRQYPKHIDREIEILLEDSTTLTGRLIKVEEEALEILPLIKSKVKGRKDKEGETRIIPFDQIKESKIKLSFK
jgi:ribosome maturation factor RimP